MTRKISRERNRLLPTLIVAGSAVGLAASPASALELGDIQIESTLGQPLRASIAYALNPHEELYDFCIFLKPGTTSNGLAVLSKASVRITSSAIVLNGAVPIREPMLAMQLSVNCPYTAHLARDYTLMFNPATIDVDVAQAQSAAPSSQSAPLQAAASAVQRQPRSAVVVDQTPIAQATDYRVQRGDSLSGIASRIEDRSVGLWPAVDALFAANPDAFFDGDVNRLKAGSVLQIPDFLQADSQATAAATETASVAEQSGSASAYSGYSTTVDPGVAEYEAVISDDTSVLDSGTADSAAVMDTVDPQATSAEPQPGDIFLDGDGPYVSPIDAGDTSSVSNSPQVIIPDTQIESPTRAVPVVSSDSSSAADSGGSWTWLMWLGGTGIALIAGLLLFGRRIRESFGASPAGSFGDSEFDRRQSEADLATTVSDVDFQIDSDEIENTSMSLDADLGAGTGLQDSADIDVAQDFGFIADGDTTDKIDLELPESAAAEPEANPTDVIPPSRPKPVTILEREVPPGDADGEYDLSMIVDATKQAIDEMEDTAKDLMAVQIDSEDAVDETSLYTMSKEVDYKVLEQDYEEELTATQALNEEIAKAALQLAERMDGTEPFDLTAELPAVADAPVAGDDTAEVPVGQDAEITVELTANLPANADAENEEFGDLDDTGVNEELTVEMPQSGDDPTVEMEIESGTIDTKNIKAS